MDVAVSVDGYLQGWVDFNKNGSWADTGEQVFSNALLTSGVNSLSFPVPLTASAGYPFARFRFGSQTNLAITGAAGNGEVEDYRIEIITAGNFDTICEGTSLPLTPSMFGGKPPFTFSWTSNPAGFVSGVRNPFVNPVEPTVYTCIITD
jgi:hypothetical protein